MGLFSGIKERKAIKKRMFIKRSMTNMSRLIRKLEEKKQFYITKAKDDKKKGSDAQVKLALDALKMTMAFQQRAETMLLNFEIAYQMRDMGDMTSQFFKGISVMSKEMSSIANSTNFLKVQKQFEVAMMKMEDQATNVEAFMDMSQDTFTDVAQDAQKIDDKEISKLIDVQVSEEDQSVDTQEIDNKIDEIQKNLKSI
jgi:hypothetical protein